MQSTLARHILPLPVHNRPLSIYNLPNLISVAGTDSIDNLATWSNWGAKSVTVAAPGANILTTQMGGGYRTVTGTSASTPMVAGIAGLIKTMRPWMWATEIKQIISDSARQVTQLNGRVSSGGIVNGEKGLGSLRGPYDPPPNGNGNGNGKPKQTPTPPPAPPPGQGKNAGSGTPSPGVKGAPGANLPDLDALKKVKKSPAPVAPPARIHADLIPLCDVDCGGVRSGGVGGAGGPDPRFGTVRKQPGYKTGSAGVALGSRNFNWSLPIVNLPGRADLDLNITLYYNSLVWIKQGTQIQFNPANAYDGAPGFSIGFPTLQARFTDQQTGKLAYTMVTPSGGTISLQQIGSGSTYESLDSSHTFLNENGNNPIVTTTDGTQYYFTYYSIVNEYRCTKIEDRNGNFHLDHL